MPFGIEMKLARKIAYEYGLKTTEAEHFAKCWTMRRRADGFAKRWAPSLEAEVISGYRRMAQWTRGTPSYGKGHTIVRRLPTPGARYVVFSDHHWSYPGNRQDFFGLSGNRDLYVEVLGKYATSDYTLVENGDVEELLVFEPTKAELDRRLAMNQNQLDTHRHGYRLQLLNRILNHASLRPLYDALADFQSRGRLVRVAGNHDFDLQEPDFQAALARRVPGILKPCDYLFLQTERSGRDPKIDYVVAHGHQFDKATNGRYAKWIGETISETMSWAYQGADRTWRWDDGVKEWALGQTAFRGDLVDDDYNPNRGNVLDVLGVLFNNLHSSAAWEAVFKHNIAWEYFEESDPQDAITNEVSTGDEFFKFRHLDELTLKKEMQRNFPTAAERPTLVLGHTHEVRCFQAPMPGPIGKNGYRWYLNSGAAGRFENLIWGLEIEDGVSRLVSWSRPAPGAGVPERRVWTHLATLAGHRLAASQTPASL